MSEKAYERVVIRALKSTIVVSGLSKDEAATLETAWELCLLDPGAGLPSSPTLPEHVTEIRRDPALSWTQFHEDLTRTITHKAIESCRGEYFMFHAAAVADQDSGNAMVLVGKSGTGKSTATRVLGQAFAYLTDETAALSVEGTMITYPKPLSLLTANGIPPKEQYSPASLGLTPLTVNARLTRLVLLERTDERHADPAYWTELPLLTALERLIPESSSLAYLDRGIASLCDLIDSVGGVRVLHYSEAEHLIPFIKEELETPHVDSSGTAARWQLLPVDHDGKAPSESGLYRRALVDDATLVDGAVALLHNEQFTVLDGIGPALWETLERWAHAEELVDKAVQEFGSHAEAQSMVMEALEKLRERGLLERSKL
ncbi:PqqD family protein [Arthrobacter sp. AOP36-C1-22]